jgi:hypothetical protein
MDMSSNSTGNMSSVGGIQHNNTDMGNPNGNVVNNDAGANPSRDTSKVYNVGTNLRGMACAPHLRGL